MTRPRVALCMIVRNEAHVIQECLDSIAPHVDFWIVRDSGSTDGTQELVRRYFHERGIPGEIHGFTWRGFAEGRTGALALCDGKADYAWVIDADDRILGPFAYPDPMDRDAYELRIRRAPFGWWRKQIFRTGMGWRYEGVIHEWATCPRPGFTSLRLPESAWVDSRALGDRSAGRSIEQKYLQDAALLLDAVGNPLSPHYAPEQERYLFNLGQSYYDAGHYEAARQWSLKHCALARSEEAAFLSAYRVGLCDLRLGGSWDQCLPKFLQAWAFRPWRAEPLATAAAVCRHDGFRRVAYPLARVAAQLSLPWQENFFVDESIYRWRAWEELAAAAVALGKWETAREACARLLDGGALPETERRRVRRTLEAAERREPTPAPSGTPPPVPPAPAPWHDRLLPLLAAWERDPARAELLVQASEVCRAAGYPAVGYLFASAAAESGSPALYELAETAGSLDRHEEGREACRRLLNNPGLPSALRPRVEELLAFDPRSG